MKIIYSISSAGNLGDDINAWLFPALAPDFFDDDESEVFIGIGSVLDKRFSHYPMKHVFGAGARAPDSVPTMDGSWKFHCVRGPLTAAALGLAPTVAVTDPGIMVSRFFKRDERPARVGLVPYFRRNPGAWEDIAAALDFLLIPPNQDAASFFDQLRQCKYVLTESLHGAIFADALRIPWLQYRSYAPIKEGRVTSEFKWNDWQQSMALDAPALELPTVWPESNRRVRNFFRRGQTAVAKKTIVKRFKAVLNEQKFNLSDDNIFLSVRRRYEEVFDAFVEAERRKS